MKYCYGGSEENFVGTVDCATIEEAISECIRELDLQVGQTAHVGTARDYVPSLCASTILEDIGNSASDEIGEAADGWPNVSKEEEDLLQKALDEVWDNWITSTGNKPNFYHIDDYRAVPVTQEMFDKAYTK